MKKTLLFIIPLLGLGCGSSNEDEVKKCSCYIQQYKRTVILKKQPDGTFIAYSDTGWNINGNKTTDNNSDCSKNETIQSTDEIVNVSSEYHRTISLKWVYKCN
ncbi:hypothetical protein [Chryseobacterium rhizosphaerae]|uniref:hypothetical protein n=1 Tax=Chryseobacterium rhizosphaerae TaxID=395937 RepID=UPI003D0B6315